MQTTEDIRKNIIEGIFNHPELGKNYIDYNTEDGKCGLTIIFKNQNQKFDIIIENHKENDLTKEHKEKKERLKEIIRKCHRQSWGLTEDDFYELLIINGITINDVNK
jgi:hypothetical protein